MRSSFDLKVCIDGYLATLERWADTKDLGGGDWGSDWHVYTD